MEKVIDLEDRIPSLREKRKRRTNFKFIILTAIFVIVLLFLLYLQSSYSKIQAIEVSGDKLEQEEYYIEQAELALGNSMWGFTSLDIEKKLSQLEWIETVKVKRKLFTTVKVELQEYDKVAYMLTDTNYYPILENGYIFEKSVENMPIDAPIFDEFEDGDLRKRLVKELSKIKPSILALISQIKIIPTDADPYALTLYMNDGYEIRADLTTLAEKIKYYPSIVAQIETVEQPQKGIIDIEVGTYYQSFQNEYGEGIPIVIDEETGEAIVSGQTQAVETEQTEEEPVFDATMESMQTSQQEGAASE